MKKKECNEVNILKKIGILTYYYDSVNYGGNLQAYALCKKLEKMGYAAEQICFNANVKVSSKTFKGRIKRILSVIKRKVSLLFRYRKNKQSNKIIEGRKKAFEFFNKALIPHSKKVYTVNNISETNELYNCFIAGSDQIWNLSWYVPTYFLDFVKEPNVKAAYAASFGITSFTSEQKSLIKNHLRDYKMLSLREHSSLENDGVFEFKPEVLADPTLLLTEQDWLEVTAPKIFKEKYIFCYFFGEGVENRLVAAQYARQNGYKIVTIPHLNGENPFDSDFGDLQIEDCSPQEFLSLIKNAEAIFTDSFHAVVFSYIFKKNFFVFKRNRNDSMSSRIYSITQLFGTEERFCSNEDMVSVDYISSVPDHDYSVENHDLVELINKSEEYLHNIGNLREDF